MIQRSFRRDILVGVTIVALLICWLLSTALRPDSKSLNEVDPETRGSKSAVLAVASEEALPLAKSSWRGVRSELALDQVPKVSVAPKQDRESLVRKAVARSKADGGYRFAAAIPVQLTPDNSGQWDRTMEGMLRWRLQVHSPAAESLNFGFSRYHMPEGGRLSLSRPGEESPYRDFTAEDNEEHGQLWTPLLGGELALLEVEVPNAAAAESLDLELASVNHGFRGWKRGGLKIGGEISGSCNLDVACGGGDGFPLVEMFSDEIRSVGAYTLGGIDTCTGALVNNTAQDNKPYFLTAHHCGIDTGNDASVVVYWNFQNSTCRQPNSGASGGVADGNLTQFNSGSIFRASHGNSDFCLIELDDPINPTFNLFFSGWDRSGAQASTAVGIHHPAVAEKRISFEFEPTTTDTFGGSSGASHVRVHDWDIGTTEPGSSGSPLYDQDGRIIGQLHGGPAACGNDDSDYYGRVSASWIGGGSASTRLSNWLDPVGSGATTLNGKPLDEVIDVESASIAEGHSGTRFLDFTVRVSPATDETLTVRWDTQPGTASAGSDFVTAGGTLQFAPQVTEATVRVQVRGDLDPEEHEMFSVVLSNATNAIAGRNGTGTILNDDFIVPLITSPGTASAVEGRAFSYQITAQNTPTAYALIAAPAGMSIDATTGLVSWIPPAPGPVNLQIVASNPAGSVQSPLTIQVTENSVLNAVDLTNVSISESATPWFLQGIVTIDGQDAAQSGNIGDNQSTWFEIQIQGPEVLEFDWKVSSEEDFDFLTLSVNGSVNRSLDGDVNWRHEMLNLPAGNHIVRWEYSKDGSVSEGSDAGWVDRIILASQSEVLRITSPIVVGIEAQESFVYQVVTSQPVDSIQVTGLPPGFSHDGNGLISGLAPGADFSFGVTASNAGGSDQVTVQVQIGIPLGVGVDVNPALGGSITLNGPQPWFAQESVNHDNVDAAQSGAISDNQSTEFEMTVRGPGVVRFWWKVDSEFDYDFLEFSVNGTVRNQISGDDDWSFVSTNLTAGDQRLTWSYSKDGSVSEGRDAGWVDQITFTFQTNQAPVFENPIAFRTPFETTTFISNEVLLNGVTDPDGDAVAVSATQGSGNGGFARLFPGGIQYAPRDGFSGDDSFTIIVIDARGRTTNIPATATVDPPPADPGSTPLEATALENGRMEIVVQVVAGRSYLLQRTVDGTTWQTIDTPTAGPDGEVRVIDSNPPQPKALYRLALP